MSWGPYALVFVAGLIAAFGTSLGAVPLFWVDAIDDKLDVGLWGFAGGLMASASVFGLLFESYKKDSSLLLVGGGIVSGIVLVIVAHRVVDRYGTNYRPEDIAMGDFQTILNILLVLFVHSFPEGLAIGVSFAELNRSGGIHLLGFSVPFVAIAITGSLAIHNFPEGLATAIPINDVDGIGNGRMWGAAFFTSLPQPVGAVIAFYFVRLAEQFLGFGYGFAAGSMLYLVIGDVLPEGLEAGENVSSAKWYLSAGVLVGFVAFVPLVFVL
ncbi:hypothetical protein BG842_18855 [Haladaptatus sp. W1]|uniref:ZIP family metal transporter n=1 Tax=Haladaptatus sp. W1 TaxID=1897478 RepID=UPI000849B93F|nr:ZIP family metal transporter [Haladaptatus sp. W1]ODR80209.1 hypothetical protein BG842_18855 [Haladaptatus sp. W1]